jgi:hypothetical protein
LRDFPVKVIAHNRFEPRVLNTTQAIRKDVYNQRMEPTVAEIVQSAVDALLLAVAKSAQDLQSFHDTVARARQVPLAPFPRATVVVAERIVDDLKRVEQDLRNALVDLGISP